MQYRYYKYARSNIVSRAKKNFIERRYSTRMRRITEPILSNTYTCIYNIYIYTYFI